MQNISQIMQDRIRSLHYVKAYAYSIFPEEISSIVTLKNIQCCPKVFI